MRSYLLCALLSPLGAIFGLLQVSKIVALVAALGVPINPAVIFRFGFAAYLVIPVTPISVGVLFIGRRLKKRRERQQWSDGPDGQVKRVPWRLRVFEE